jgi:hypothetical protein
VAASLVALVLLYFIEVPEQAAALEALGVIGGPEASRAVVQSFKVRLRFARLPAPASVLALSIISALEEIDSARAASAASALKRFVSKEERR